MDFFDSSAIENIASHSEWVGAMEKALQLITTGSVLLPRRMHLDRGDSTYLIMPCITDDYWATKLVSFCPENRKKELPSIYGTLVLNDTKTGKALAIMEGGMITAMRTAAVTAAGIRQLSQPDARSLGIIGTGTQGIYQALFAIAVRRIDEIWAYDSNPANLKLFVDQMKIRHPEISVNSTTGSEQVALKSQVIISATNSKNPVFKNSKELFTGRTFVGIGSYNPDCMEFPEQLFRQTGQVFVDTMDGKGESGDLITPVEKKWISGESIFPIGDLISGKIAADENQTRLFKTVGSAIFDLFAAKLVYEKHTGKSQD